MNCGIQFGVPCWVLGDERYILTITSWAFFFFLTSRCTVNHWLEPSSCLAWFQAWNCFQDHFIAAGEGFFGEAKRELLCTETVQRSWKNCIWWLRWEREKKKYTLDGRKVVSLALDRKYLLKKSDQPTLRLTP